ncbi:MFS transporter [Lentilactobacillus otakiensis]|uniref:Major facilitator superfamily permease n=1 Tax=Lentilactobacillus otakiensis DSM 19908 = JCM 15040 TaxID=1423780 RepID=S4PQB9_9LACO|nr:MFS transporter [Lentilactobacillus otakiensis]KRL12041.1 major facilitator superfamily permease [Lentilactobacillus otakiensis DSM 19908 = JCM 15040]MDV3517377.1 MFS transporter [Lentilactobacillus otakiensis]GAD17075.1 major facilitator superfamily permease [Lentilactobacillus otakiensis DSM 19908 = JCM 15040]
MEQQMEVQERIDKTKESPLFYKIFALVAGGMFLDACDVFLASAVATTILKSQWATLSQESYFLSSGFLGLFIGSILAGFIGDFKGRKVAYQFNLLLFSVFTFLAAFAPNMAFLIICRLVAAIGLGSEIVTGYAMINEFAPVQTRGRWCAITALVANAGAPVTLVTASIIIPRFGWRVLFIGVGIVAGVLWYLRRDIPESPRWLIAHGRMQEANKTIEKLEVNGVREDTDSFAPKQVIHRHSFGVSLFVAVVAVSAVIVCQFTFTSWVPTLLSQRGLNISNSLWTTAFIEIGAPVGCGVGAILVDRIGRKKTIIPAFFMTAVFGFLYAQQSTMTGVITVGFMLEVCFYILMAAVVAVYTSELFETKVRVRGAGIANGVAKLFTVAMPIVVAWMLKVSSPSVIFITISGIALFAGIVVWVFGDETNQKNIG